MLVGLTAVLCLCVGFVSGKRVGSRVPEEWPLEDHGTFVSTGDAGSL